MSGKAAGSLGRFVVTEWSMVARAGATNPGGKRESLGALVQIYLPALRAHLRVTKGMQAGQVEDLLQGFVTDKIVEQNLIGRADQSKGKFRSFLLTALDRYVIDQSRKEKAGKRAGPGKSRVSVEEQPELVATRGESSTSFDMAWARELIAETLRRMKVECDEAERGDLWGMFECRVVRPAFEGGEAMGYEELVKRFGLKTPLQASNALTTAKRMFARQLRAVAGEYAGPGALAEREIADLKEILSKAGA